jgi:DNA polymerase III epsilon subunit-like protein
MTYFSVDVETAGRVPGRHDLLSVGIVEVATGRELYVVSSVLGTPEAIRWERDTFLWWVTDPEARDELPQLFAEPVKLSPQSMANEIANFVTSFEGPRTFVGWPASFDYPFIAELFASANETSFFAAVPNPFHHRTVDVKSWACGKFGVPIDATRDQLPGFLNERSERPHHALHDARAQANVFRKLLAWGQS